MVANVSYLATSAACSFRLSNCDEMSVDCTYPNTLIPTMIAAIRMIENRIRDAARRFIMERSSRVYGLIKCDLHPVGTDARAMGNDGAISRVVTHCDTCD